MANYGKQSLFYFLPQESHRQAGSSTEYWCCRRINLQWDQNIWILFDIKYPKYLPGVRALSRCALMTTTVSFGLFSASAAPASSKPTETLGSLTTQAPSQGEGLRRKKNYLLDKMLIYRMDANQKALHQTRQLSCPLKIFGNLFGLTVRTSSFWLSQGLDKPPTPLSLCLSQ